MQIIQKIRDKGAVIVIIVISLSLIGFILMDANQGGNLFSSNSTAVGKVNGEKIDVTYYNEKVKQVEEQYGNRGGANMIYQARQTAWDQIVLDKVLDKEFAKLGLSFTPLELSSIMFSDDAPYTLKQSFSKENGEYDIDKVKEWWAQAKKFKNEQKKMVEVQIVEPIKLNALYGKYTSLISAGTFYPDWMKAKDAAESKNFAVISYVSVPYTAINDSSIKVTDDDIKGYLENNELKYKQDGGRMISYVAFDATASSADTLKTLESVTILKDAFRSEPNAKNFVARNLSTISFDSNYTLKSKLTMSQKDSIAALPIGGVFGPYLDGKNFVLAKMLASRTLPDSVKCRHILIGLKDQTGAEKISDSAAKVLADSIAFAVKSGANFNELVVKYSDDPGSKDKGGEYDFTSSQFGSLARPFAETIFYGSAGDKKVVKTDFGYHYIEVMSQKNFEPAYEIAYLAKEIYASDETTNEASINATRLSGEARDLKAFDAYVTKNKLNKVSYPTLIKENDYQVSGLQDARQIVKWAYEAKQGDVSEAFSVGEQYVVAVVEKIVPEGIPDVQSARPQVEYLIRNQKKAEEIKKKLGTPTTLEAAATAYGKAVEMAGTDSSLTFSSQIINGVGRELKVIGAAFDKALQSKVSAPIEGDNGVYVIKVNSVQSKPADTPEVAAENAMSKEKALMQQSYGWYESLKKMADIEDKRSKYF